MGNRDAFPKATELLLSDEHYELYHHLIPFFHCLLFPFFIACYSFSLFFCVCVDCCQTWKPNRWFTWQECIITFSALFLTVCEVFAFVFSLLFWVIVHIMHSYKNTLNLFGTNIVKYPAQALAPESIWYIATSFLQH